MYKEILGAHQTVLTSLSERDVLELQDCFLVPGVHTLVVKNGDEGRGLVQPLLSLLSTSLRIAALSLAATPFAYPVVSLYEEIKDQGLETGILSDWEDYLVASFYYDVLVVEATKELITSTWFSYLKQVLENSGIIHQTSVILLESRQ